MSDSPDNRRSSFSNTLAVPHRQRTSSGSFLPQAKPTSARHASDPVPTSARRASDAELADREKQNYDLLRRRISNFVGHAAYEEETAKTDKHSGQKEDNGGSSEPKLDNFAQNYIKAKKNLAEGSHDKMYKWMGFSSEKEMQHKSGGKKLAVPSSGDLSTRRHSGTSTTSGGISGNDTRGRRKSSTGNSPRKSSMT